MLRIHNFIVKKIRRTKKPLPCNITFHLPKITKSLSNNMQQLAPYGTPVNKASKAKKDSHDLWDGGRVKATVMNDLLYRSEIIDNIMIDDGSWKPQSFKSSRRNKHVRSEEDLQLFMDEDDMRSWEAQRVLVPVIQQRTMNSISNQFLQFVEWQRKKSIYEDKNSLRLFISFQNFARPVTGSSRGLFTSTKQELTRKAPAKEKVVGRKAKKQRVSMKLSISDDYDVEDYKKVELPSVARSDSTKPKFIPRSSRLLTQKQEKSLTASTAHLFEISTENRVKYDTFKWPAIVKSEIPDPKEKPIINEENVPKDLKDLKVTVQAFKKLSIVPPLESQIASDALTADSFPFVNDPEKQQRYIYFLKVHANIIPNTSFYPITRSFTFDSWKHELNEFTQLALRYRPLSFELAQRFAPASTQPLDLGPKGLPERTVEKFVPVPLLLTRFGISQTKQDKIPEPLSVAPPEHLPLRSDIVNLYENLSLIRGKKPRSLFEKIFKNA